MFALWPRCHEKRGSLCRSELGLLEEKVAPLDISTGRDLGVFRFERHRQQRAGTDMAVFLERLTGQEVLQEAHVRMTHIGSQVHLRGFQRALPDAVQSLARSFPKGLRVHVAAVLQRILVGVLAEDEASRLLVEIRGRENGLQRAGIVERPVSLQLQLALPVPRCIAKSAVVGHDKCRVVRFFGRTRKPGAQPQKIIGAGLDGDQILRWIAGGWRQHIDDAVQRIRSIQRIARTADHLDGSRLFRVQFEHLVDVAESRRPHRHAVFEEQEAATGSGTGEDRRANGSQVFLAAAATEPDTGNAGHQFVDVLVADVEQCPGTEPCDIARMLRERLLSTPARDHDFFNRGFVGCRVCIRHGRAEPCRERPRNDRQTA